MLLILNLSPLSLTYSKMLLYTLLYIYFHSIYFNQEFYIFNFLNITLHYSNLASINHINKSKLYMSVTDHEGINLMLIEYLNSNEMSKVADSMIN